MAVKKSRRSRVNPEEVGAVGMPGPVFHRWGITLYWGARQRSAKMFSLLERGEFVRFECKPRSQAIVMLAVLVVHSTTFAADPGGPKLAGAIVPQLSVEVLNNVREPFQQRDPKRFWLGKKVFQKRGIVVEDKDYIVRDRYWELDEFVIGTVAEVKSGAQGPVCRVMFENRDRWQQKGFEKKPEGETVVREFERKGYERTTITTSYRIEGVAVEKQGCGLVVEDGAAGLIVEFPSSLLSLVKPRLHDQVVRGPDWFDGFADGGATPSGPASENPEVNAGIVVAERDVDGNVDVEWLQTGRVSTHRFDSRQFYDIELLESTNAAKE